MLGQLPKRAFSDMTILDSIRSVIGDELAGHLKRGAVKMVSTDGQVDYATVTFEDRFGV